MNSKTGRKKNIKVQNSTRKVKRLNNKVLPNSVLKSQSNKADEKAERYAIYKKIFKNQIVIDSYNMNYVGNTSRRGINLIEEFKKIQLSDGLVVQLYNENRINNVILTDDGKEIKYVDSSIRQIDARLRTSDAVEWVDTLFPVIYKGIIMSISPAVTLKYMHFKNELTKIDKKLGDSVLIPEVGDTIYTKEFQYKNAMFYLNKQEFCNDYVKHQELAHLKSFDFLFKIDAFQIESIVKKGSEAELLDRPMKFQDRLGIQDIFNEMFKGEDITTIL